MLKIKFNYNELLKADNWLKYCQKYNINCSSLHNDNSSYYVNMNISEGKRLVNYLQDDKLVEESCLLAQAAMNMYL